jgi:uncharacterized membrane protein
MPSKYDTNPLDPDFPEKVKTEAQQSAATQFLPVDETRQFAPEAEDATRRFSPDMTSAYSMPANPTFPVQPFYQNVSVGNIDESKERKVAKLGLPENVLVAAPYIPWFFGFVAGLALLLLTPKSESKVRFHAAQGLAAHIGIFGVSVVLGIFEEVTDLSNAAETIFTIVTSVMLVIFAYKAFRGKPIHIAIIEDLTNYLDEKIGPIKT